MGARPRSRRHGRELEARHALQPSPQAVVAQVVLLTVASGREDDHCIGRAVGHAPLVLEAGLVGLKFVPVSRNVPGKDD